MWVPRVVTTLGGVWEPKLSAASGGASDAEAQCARECKPVRDCATIANCGSVRWNPNVCLSAYSCGGKLL